MRYVNVCVASVHQPIQSRFTFGRDIASLCHKDGTIVITPLFTVVGVVYRLTGNWSD